MGDLAKEINSKFENNRIKAMLNIIYTANWISSSQNEFFKPFGISPQQYNILRILNGSSEALKVQTIKERMLERSPNATRLMDKLCAKNYIDRLPSEHDRRVVKIAITDKGVLLLKDISKTKRENLLHKLTEEEASKLSDLLDKIR